MSRDIHTGDNPADDFDLFWGMGPSEKHDPPLHHGTSNAADISTTSSSSSAPSHSAASTLSAAGTTTSSLGVSGGGGGLNPTATTLMGSLWSHSGGGAPEAYGHRHHVHASHGDGGAVAGLHHVHHVPSPVRSRRPVWLPPPNQHHQHSSTSSTTTSRAGEVGAPGSNHVGQHHHLPPATGSPVQAVVVDVGGGDAAAISPPSSSARINGHNLNRNNSSTSGDGNICSNVECKLEELAVAIKSSVLGKVETGVREALLMGQQHQRQRQEQSGGGAPFVAPRAGAASKDDQRRTEAAEAEAVAAAVAPLRSRLAALEEQMSQLMATASIDRIGSSNSGGGGGDTRKGGRGGSGGVGGGVGLGRAGGGGSAAEAEPLVALNALAQRTGTLEGRHKQVQAKVALLDNAFGPKASDWAQTIKAFLQEREAAVGVAAVPRGAGRAAAPVPAVHSAPGGGGGKGGKRKLAVDAPVFSPRVARTGCGSGGAPAEGGEAATLTGLPSLPLDVVAGTKYDKSAPETVGATRIDGTAEANCKASAVASEATERAGGRDKVVDRCIACAEAQERCSRLEKRVEEVEGALAALQSKAATMTSAATTAVADAVKAWEAAENNRRDAAAEKAASSSSGSLGRQQKAPPATSGGGGAGNWASKSSLEKLAGELRHLSERTRDGEDAVALVDHGLKGVRDEVR